MGNLPPKLKNTPEGLKALYAKLDNESKKKVEDYSKELGKTLFFEKALGVLIKILASEGLKKKVGSKIKEAALVFSTPATLKKLYLNTDWAQVLVEYEKEFGPDDGKDHFESSGGFTSTAKTHEVEDVEEKLTTISEIYAPELHSVFKTVKIKLVIAEVSHSKTGQNFRRMVSPVLSKLDLLPEFGMFHSALMIGPYMIDWNDSGICIPRKCVSQAALISADVGEISSEPKLEDIIDNLAKLICQWNATRLYKDQLPKTKDEGNCQDFVTDILQVCGIKAEFGGPMGIFMKKMREEGKCKISFEMDNAFRDAFGVKEKCIEFKSHKELDDFVNKLYEKDHSFPRNYPDHHMLLKSFDRAFWLRHFKAKSEDKYKPSGDEQECECPFKNPLETGSMREEN